VTNLTLYTSNRLEILADMLAEKIRIPLSRPFDEEIIVVQSKGMERWVSIELAGANGICANARFPFPDSFVHEIFKKVIKDLPEDMAFDPKKMTWKIMKVLPSLITRPGFEGLKNYLGDRGEDLKRFQLSERISNLFDQYLLFRPEMILAWERGKEDHWQAVLWRELVRGSELRHRAALGEAFIAEAKNRAIDIDDFPERICVFGISALPRFHIEILAGISRFIEVNFFLMNPCREYWADIVSDWEMKKTIDRQRSEDVAYTDLHLEKGNNLLASMGALGRDFFNLINEFDYQEITAFEDLGEESILSCLQSDILNLSQKDTGIGGNDHFLGADDTSFKIHSCHSAMREIEVLYDQLLDMFEKDPSLLPKDVLVMTPDIETYAPYIQAVFGVPEDEHMRFPFTIADRSARLESRMIDTFLDALDLCKSRFSASEVMAILESRPVYERFGFSEGDLVLVRRWIKDTGIRWGIDEQSRRRLDLPALSENTWQAGLDRLVLGYAMPGYDKKLFDGILPYDYVEGGEAVLLGRFLAFCHTLFDYVVSFERKRRVEEWSELLISFAEGLFFLDEKRETEWQLLKRTLADLADVIVSGESVFDEQIDVAVVRWHLGRLLEEKGFGFGFIDGGITFCAMLPMRSIPFRVICLVGMNGDIYPRQSKPIGFDLMAKHPRPGDRSRRRDDRYLFLEAILSARQRLYISYVGQSIKDNSIAPPSVLVSELVDYVEERFEGHCENIFEKIFTKHRLQAFSPEYFKSESKLFSYSKMNYQAARSIGETIGVLPFISKGLDEPGNEWKIVDLRHLCSFFNNGARFLLNRRLGIYLEEKQSVLKDQEHFELASLEKYILEQALVEKGLSGEEIESLFPITKASGLLPHGVVGVCLYDNICQDINRFVEKTRPYVLKPKLEPVDVDVVISDFRLTGKIDVLYEQGLVQYRHARLKAKDRLRVWIYHLVLSCIRSEHLETSKLIGLRKKDKQYEWTALEYTQAECAEKILSDLLKIYWNGLMRTIHFFPESAWEYANALLDKGRQDIDATRKARRIYFGDEYHWSECEDAYYELCFRDTDPIDSEFKDLAVEIFEPLIRHEAIV